MKVENNPFTSGVYHARRKAELENVPGLATGHNRWLTRRYTTAEDIIENQGWENPIMRNNARVLQMGIENYRTTDTFARFVHERNPSAKITVADFSIYPLQECRITGVEAKHKIRLVHADTTALHEVFPEKVFDLIETDGLFQFLNPAQKTETLKQWYRVLKPGGMVTTRDRVVSINHDNPGKWNDLNDWSQQLKTRLGVQMYATTTEVMRYKFRKQGFDVVFDPIDADNPRSKLVHHMVARKPDSTK